MGTHDLDLIKGPFTYKALNAKQTSFKALKQSQSMPSDKLLEVLVIFSLP